MEKRIKATKIQVVPSQLQLTSKNTSSENNASSTTRQTINYQNSHPKMSSQYTAKKEGESKNGCFIVSLCIGMIFFTIILPNMEMEHSSPSSSSNAPQKKYCKYEGCTEPPSEFWEAGTGFCRRHAQQLRDQEKMIDKLKTQGY